MSNLNRYVKLLEENEKATCKEAKRILSMLCNNIIDKPEEVKYRKVRLSNATVVEKILPAAGAMECLFEVGFVENDDHLLLPLDASLSKLTELRRLLSELRDKGTTEKPLSQGSANVTGAIVQNSVPPSTGNEADTASEKSVPQSSANSASVTARVPVPQSFAKPAVIPKYPQGSFFNSIKKQFQSVLRYEDLALQERARSVVPLTKLHIGAIERMRSIQRDIKLNGNEQSTEDITMEDLLILELLRWFKQEFFQWVDSPPCSLCSGSCTSKGVISSSDHRISRIEIHRCGNCGTEVQFPRYSDPAMLLITRKGRCGEWANAFTLICRSLGYDARLVSDQTDHVWTEVWSVAENRWIHADPCENVMDRPLMYEKGWGKQLNYILAYSRDEVQDVTWRYTRDQSSVMKRRTLCTEGDLLSLIRSLNEERQSSVNYSVTRKQFITKRCLLELVEFLPAPPGSQKSCRDEGDYQGRTSGSLAWRIARGETDGKPHQSRSWIIPKDAHTFELRYFASKDTYQTIGNDGKVLEERKGWEEGVDETTGGIFRKVEDDWKMVYLSRSPEAKNARVKWTFQTDDSNVLVDLFYFRATTAVFHDASIQWKVEGFYKNGKTKVVCITDPKNFNTDRLKGSVKLSVTAKLSGGKDDLAWQHAQLFRQSLNATEHSMIVRIKLNKCT